MTEPSSHDKEEVLEEFIPKQESDDKANGHIFADIAANIHQYTERPDLLIAEIEKHDPGFIKQLNKRALEFSDKTRKARFDFGKRQAYVSLFVSSVSAIAVLAAMFYLIYRGDAGIGTFLGIGAVFAITQGGPGGFTKIIQACEKAISKMRGK